MSVPPQADEVERFRVCVERRLGLNIEEGRQGALIEILGRRAARDRGRIDLYLAKLESDDDGASAELRTLAQELTITETYFLRNADHMRAFREAVVPALANSPSRKLRILSAGCASGEEPYSLAILLREPPYVAASFEVSILAIDVNPKGLERAAKALYSPWSLRETPAELKTRWFRRVGDHFALDESVRAMVTFEERNLVQDDPTLWQAAAFDVVFCRNVMMYFAPETARAVVSRIARSLVPGGFLFLGHAETLRGLSQDFHLRHTHDTFYYQRRATADFVRPDELPRPAWLPRSEPLVSTLDRSSWVDAIRVSSERVQSLTQPAGPVARPAGGKDVLATTATGTIQGLPVWSVALVVDLLRQERFAEAKELLSALPPESAHDPDVLLLQAVLFTHGGDPAKAEALCAELIDRDDTNAGAHYLTALCREHVGDSRGATEQDQIAVYLDPSFAMPRLHLGLLARRVNDVRSARREFIQALALLEREDASRLLLFGGGFGREALMALCRAELTRCGGES